jgi:protein-tyrosine phosphatase
MTTKIYWVYHFKNAAKIGIMPRPRGGDWLADEIKNLKKEKVGVLVSLLEQDEICELILEMEEKYCLKNGIEFIHFPIKDRDIPNDNEKLEKIITLLTTKIKGGTSIMVHCRMGIGRSSIIAAAVLLNWGSSTKEIMKKISEVRGLKVPDTAEQLNWLLTMENK